MHSILRNTQTGKLGANQLLEDVFIVMTFSVQYDDPLEVEKEPRWLEMVCD